MTDNRGMLVLCVGDGEEYDFGTITSFSDSLNKTVTTTPIVSRSTDSTFAIESGSAMKFSVQFSRRNPEDPRHEYNQSKGSTTWCNATWVRMVSSLCKRWQAETDGYTMYFNHPDKRADGTPNPNYPSLKYNVYISSLSFSFSEGMSDLVTGSLSLTVGGITEVKKIWT